MVAVAGQNLLYDRAVKGVERGLAVRVPVVQVCVPFEEETGDVVVFCEGDG